MTTVVVTYILVAPEGFQLSYLFSVIISVLVAVALTGWFFTLTAITKSDKKLYYK
jgi:hypothetical protein